MGGAFVPVTCGTAFKNKGVQPMLDAVVRYLPSPLDLPPMKGVDVKDPEKELVRNPSDDEPFSGLAFKIMTDPFVGSLTFVRIYSGVLESGSYVQNTGKGKKERVGRLLELNEKPGGMREVNATVPLSEMFNYVSRLRSVTKGRGNYTMVLDKYDVVPPNIAKEICDEKKLA